MAIWLLPKKNKRQFYLKYPESRYNTVPLSLCFSIIVPLSLLQSSSLGNPKRALLKRRNDQILITEIDMPFLDITHVALLYYYQPDGKLKSSHNRLT